MNYLDTRPTIRPGTRKGAKNVWSGQHQKTTWHVVLAPSYGLTANVSRTRVLAPRYKVVWL